MWPHFVDLDPIDAIMYRYHTNNHLYELTMRVELPLVVQDLSESPEDQMKATMMAVIPLNSGHGILGVLNRLPAVPKICNLEIDIGDSAAECLEDLANTYGIGDMAPYLRCLIEHDVTLISADRLNIIWRHQVEAHRDCSVKADEMFINLLVHMHTRYGLYRSKYQLTEWMVWLKELFRTGRLTSRWDLYKPTREVDHEECTWVEKKKPCYST